MINSFSRLFSSFCLGDSVVASQPHQPQQFEGVIHKMEKDRIFLKFHLEFHSKYQMSPEDYRVIFHTSRSNYIKQHNALESISNSKALKPKILLPERIGDTKMQLAVQLTEDGSLQAGNRTFGLYNQRLNDIQKFAIVNILQGQARPMPYVVFGPPGMLKSTLSPFY